MTAEAHSVIRTDWTAVEGYFRLEARAAVREGVLHQTVGLEDPSGNSIARVMHAEPLRGEPAAAVEVSLGHGQVEVIELHQEGRVALVLHQRGERGLEVGQEYWPGVGDVVIWLENADAVAALRQALDEIEL